MKKQYDETFKKQCVELVIKEGHTISSIQREFDLGHGTLNSWIKKYSSPFLDNEGTDMQELRSLRREIQALKKENEFLKRRQPSLPKTKTNTFSVYQTISPHIWSALALPSITSFC
ncbi:transposase [Bacillus cereus]|nr:transposase [Bacillus cereus]